MIPNYFYKKHKHFVTSGKYAKSGTKCEQCKKLSNPKIQCTNTRADTETPRTTSWTKHCTIEITVTSIRSKVQYEKWRDVLEIRHGKRSQARCKLGKKIPYLSWLSHSTWKDLLHFVMTGQPYTKGKKIFYGFNLFELSFGSLARNN